MASAVWLFFCCTLTRQRQELLFWLLPSFSIRLKPHSHNSLHFIFTLKTLERLSYLFRQILRTLHGSFYVTLFFLYFSWSDHEKAVGSLARRLGFTQVSLSSEIMPMVRAVPRGYTVCADAYLTPKIHQYLKGFTAGFKGGLKVCVQILISLITWLFSEWTHRQRCLKAIPLCHQDVDVLFMQSDGGLTPMEQFCGSRAVLSGPAGGVVGYAITSYNQIEKKPVIGFDMGGKP